MSEKREGKPDTSERRPLTEPAPRDTGTAAPTGPRIHAFDGLDNSDLRMLLAQAAQQAKKKE
jgi:hypothetical protein